MNPKCGCLAVALMVILCIGPVMADDGPDTPGAGEPTAREKFDQAVRKANRAHYGVHGLAVWEEFLKEHPTGPLAEQAARLRDEWKDRAERNLMRFGPTWLRRDEVEAKIVKAEELMAQSAGAGSPEETFKLLDAAAREHPYLVEVPAKKGELHYKAGQFREYGMAMDQVVRIEQDNLAARSNFGVALAHQKQWVAAMSSIGQASAMGDDDRFLDNMDAVRALAEADGASAELLARLDTMINQAVGRLHKAGLHVGQYRWAGQWVSEEQYKQLLAAERTREQRLRAIQARANVLGREKATCQATVDEAARVRAEASSGRGPRRDTAYYQQVANASAKAQSRIRAIDAELAKLKKEADSIRNDPNAPKRSDKLTIMDVLADVNEPEKPAGK